MARQRTRTPHCRIVVPRTKSALGSQVLVPAPQVLMKGSPGVLVALLVAIWPQRHESVQSQSDVLERTADPGSGG